MAARYGPCHSDSLQTRFMILNTQHTTQCISPSGRSHNANASMLPNLACAMDLQVEKGAIVAAGALVTPGTVVPSGGVRCTAALAISRTTPCLLALQDNI